MGKHALLSASSSHRWLNCPPSARLSEQYEDKGSSYAAEGTDAHTLGEYKLKTALGIRAKDPTARLTYYSEEMEECAAGYAAYIMELVETAKQTCSDPVVLIEQRLDYSKYVAGGFGQLAVKGILAQRADDRQNVEGLLFQHRNAFLYR